METTNQDQASKNLVLCGKVVGHIHGDLLKYIQKNEKKFEHEPVSRHRGTEHSVNSWANQMADIYLSQVYKVLKQKGVDNPPNAITKYFSSKDGDRKFWYHNPLSHDILMLIMCRNLDNEKLIYNYKNKIFSEHSREQLKKMLFERGILEKKKNA